MVVECPYPLYGEGCQDNCTSQCHPDGTDTMECHHIEGPNCTCIAGYIGKLCDISTLHWLLHMLNSYTLLLNRCLGLGTKGHGFVQPQAAKKGTVVYPKL